MLDGISNRPQHGTGSHSAPYSIPTFADLGLQGCIRGFGGLGLLQRGIVSEVLSLVSMAWGGLGL